MISTAGPVRVVVALVGVALLAAAATGRAALYVRGYFVPVLALTGIVLVVLAWRSPPRMSRRSWAALCLPVVVGLGIGPHQAAALSQGQLSGGLGARLGDGPNPLLTGGGGRVSVLQVELAAEQLGPVALLGRPVSLEAEVSSPTSVQRLVMVCCAADARAVTLPVQGGHLPSRGTWVRIDGRLSASNGQVVVVASRVRPASVPSQPIL